jgi:cell division protein FtsN
MKKSIVIIFALVAAGSMYSMETEKTQSTPEDQRKFEETRKIFEQRSNPNSSTPPQTVVPTQQPQEQSTTTEVVASTTQQDPAEAITAPQSPLIPSQSDETVLSGVLPQTTSPSLMKRNIKIAAYTIAATAAIYGSYQLWQWYKNHKEQQKASSKN